MIPGIEEQPKVSVIIILNNKLAVVLREKANKDGTIDKWKDLPGGKPERLPNGEMQTYAQAGELEIQQELNLTVVCYEDGLDVMPHPRPTKTSQNIVFVRGVCIKEIEEDDLINAEPDQHKDALWMDPEKVVPELLEDGRISQQVADYIYSKCDLPHLVLKKNFSQPVLMENKNEKAL